MFSPTSIADFLACQHLTALNRARAAGEIKKPFFPDPGLELLKKLGLAHEQAYLRYSAEDRGLEISKIPDEISWNEAAAQTVAAIHRGAEVIYQATFITGQWHGRADFLIRVEKPSGLGDWSYEVVETKLARSTKARAIIQLCFYTDLLSTIQGVVPDYMHVVLGGGAQPEKFSVQRYLAYFRKVRREFEAAYQAKAETYPEPVELCRVCDWSSVCDRRWRDDDHLTLVAGITRNQRKVLVENRITTVAELGRLALPAQPKIEGIGDRALLTIREQARLQVKGREEGHHIYELLEPAEEKGLCSLPLPSQGDMFLDFEGDAFAFEQGLEYLFGVVTLSDEPAAPAVYTPAWAFDRVEEKNAFEDFIATVMERLRRYPDMHIYHYGAYEETAIKRMAGQHATCGEEVDQLLRGNVLVDLFRAVQQGLRASVESYSIKKLEPLYEFTRDVHLLDANLALQTFQAVLVFGPGDEDLDEIRKAIEGYNRDDCVSTLRLRDWLEERRCELEASTGAPLPRPAAKESEPGEDLSAYLERVRAVADRLTVDIPADETERTEEQRGRWLLAQLIEWHRREDKSAWWEYFRLCKLNEEELQRDKSSLGGLVYLGPVDQVKRSIVHRYQFPLQDHAIDRAPTVHDPRTQSGVGTIVEIDERALTIDIKREASSTVPHPTALIPYEIVGSKVLRESLLQLGSWVADNGISGQGAVQAARRLLLRQPPRLKEGTLLELSARHQQLVDAAREVVLAMDNSVLPIQGPPGSGKTYTGARMIVELVNQRKRVGITAVSHKVISKLLGEVCAAAREACVTVQAIQRVDSDDGCDDAIVKRAKNNEAVPNALASGEAQVAAGTVWLWSRDDMANAVDVLFVDEAGQMSLANVLAASKAAGSVVLLGDPQQLDQPQRGVHPPGAEASALSHLLNGRATIGEDQGLFLSESWRLQPDVCKFTSEVFYDSRLLPRPENERQRLNVSGPLDGTGLRFAPVNHSGNQSESPEEAERVAEMVARLLQDGTTWTNKKGEVTRLLLEHILIVAPYNAQVSALAQSLPVGARVGTVDKFQGQEAPVVIYSMTTSTPEDAPRGMEFLYSSNRLNVATSRAQCVTVLVANPVLFDVQCKTPRQIELVNAFCRYLEMAQSM
ncbi:MAG: TM0106 family RecB-like putative nuclease [Pyrinomonadaceae bacterium]|nr:TM0106 family RecB-like putative nuclease [Pyrinomonadaceae bacterium]